MKNPNYVLRFALIMFMGVLGCGIALAWRSQLLFVSEYQEFPVTHQQLKIKKENEAKKAAMQNKVFKNYQMEE